MARMADLCQPKSIPNIDSCWPKMESEGHQLFFTIASSIKLITSYPTIYLDIMSGDTQPLKVKKSKKSDSKAIDAIDAVEQPTADGKVIFLHWWALRVSSDYAFACFRLCKEYREEKEKEE